MITKDLINDRLHLINEELDDLDNTADSLNDGVKGLYSTHSIADFVTFPNTVQNVISLLKDFVLEIESYVNDENFNKEDLVVLSPATSGPHLISSTIRKIDRKTMDDMGFQMLDEELCLKCEIPEEYHGKCVATYTYEATIEDGYNDGTTKYRNQLCYDFCIAIDEEVAPSTTDHWDSVDDRDIVFQNGHCRIFKI